MSNKLLVTPSVFVGTLEVPVSKSHIMRAILSASLATGVSNILGYLDSPDVEAMIKACQSFGAQIKVVNKQKIIIEGVASKPVFNNKIIDAGNSGIVYRFITAIAALSPEPILIDGDDSVRNNRLISPLLSALESMGAKIKYLDKIGHAPFKISGPIKLADLTMSSLDSQPISALMWLSLIIKGSFAIKVLNCQEWSWLEFSQCWLESLGVVVKLDKTEDCFILASHGWCKGFDYKVPADYSTALYPALAAILTKGKVRLKGLDKYDIQGDKLAFKVLQSWGAFIDWDGNDMLVGCNGQFIGGDVDISQCIDALPALAVAASFAKNNTRFYNATAAKFKESDRIAASVNAICSMGGEAWYDTDTLIVESKAIYGSATLNSLGDHRLVLAWVVAGLASKYPISISNFQCINKTYPNFIEDWLGCNANLTDLNVYG